MCESFLVNRRQLLQRDPSVRWVEVIADVRAAGFSTSEICFVLNVPRGTLWHWEHDPMPEPSFEDGRALLKLAAVLRP